MRDASDIVRSSRELRLQARRTRSDSKAVRATLRAGRLQSQAVVRDSRSSRAAVEVAKLIARLRAAR